MRLINYSSANWRTRQRPDIDIPFVKKTKNNEKNKIIFANSSTPYCYHAGFCPASGTECEGHCGS